MYIDQKKKLRFLSYETKNLITVCQFFGQTKLYHIKNTVYSIAIDIFIYLFQ